MPASKIDGSICGHKVMLACSPLPSGPKLRATITPLSKLRKVNEKRHINVCATAADAAFAETIHDKSGRTFLLTLGNFVNIWFKTAVLYDFRSRMTLWNYTSIQRHAALPGERQ
jgi:hypothetical protein